ncbi:MAG: sialate O-acetylesterase [Verrucomicrobiae bacterium]|nr:sialate O-acetylesterase [Verrucomicrobiae bacterium]
MKIRPFLFILTLSLLSTLSIQAGVKLPAVFSSNMVLQRKAGIPVWGWADPGEQITVKLNQQQASATADAQGQWKVQLPPTEAGGPFEMTIAGKDTVTLKNVMIGDVWVGSGQSNMAMTVGSSKDAPAEIAQANYSGIRQFSVAQDMSGEPKNNCRGGWTVCSTNTVARFSAAGYFFARELHQKLNIPIGIIHSSWGGTPAEAWSIREKLSSEPVLKPIIDNLDKLVADFSRTTFEQYGQAYRDWLAASEKARAAGQPIPVFPHVNDPRSYQSRPTVLYNAMIAPLIPYAITGVIWYQGEANAGNATLYQTLFPALIESWRKQWGQGDFPFLFVQLASYYPQKPDPTESRWAELREAQMMTLSLPKTGMAVAIDIGEAADIHPKNKQDVGKRLALAALSIQYGQTLDFSGPLYDGATVEGGGIRIKFKHTGGGLIAKDGGTLKGFAIAGADKKFVWADARIDKDTVVVSSSQIPKPAFVRYAWADNPACNLCNKAGLPASSFRTDGPLGNNGVKVAP